MKRRLESLTDCQTVASRGVSVDLNVVCRHCVRSELALRWSDENWAEQSIRERTLKQGKDGNSPASSGRQAGARFDCRARWVISSPNRSTRRIVRYGSSTLRIGIVAAEVTRNFIVK